MIDDNHARILEAVGRVEGKIDGLTERLARMEVHQEHTGRAVDAAHRHRAKMESDLRTITSELDVERGRRKTATSAGAIAAIPGVAALAKVIMDAVVG